MSIVAHDLRQPLTVILGQSQLIGRALGKERPELALKSAEAIYASANRMNVMIQDIVDGVRIDAGDSLSLDDQHDRFSSAD
jgi:signal transduction histidine kinase